ncbi:hypothetical protein B0H63DRAFT_527477 [Podospora didyma]|uniref:Uncharacterized protein n=1 Tax=Podospora didyma TaxID=330526 RepID=A0AAE0KB38_9PEZI|nr:hypothetical protein B0H63DRAFT_527477 [Podospora didyma]
MLAPRAGLPNSFPPPIPGVYIFCPDCTPGCPGCSYPLRIRGLSTKILCISKDIYEEVVDVLYSSNIFHFPNEAANALEEVFRLVQACLNWIGPNRHFIRRLRATFQHCQDSQEIACLVQIDVQDHLDDDPPVLDHLMESDPSYILQTLGWTLHVNQRRLVWETVLHGGVVLYGPRLSDLQQLDPAVLRALVTEKTYTVATHLLRHRDPAILVSEGP